MTWNGTPCIDYCEDVAKVPSYNPSNIHAVLLPGWFLIDPSKSVVIVPSGGTEYYTGG